MYLRAFLNFVSSYAPFYLLCIVHPTWAADDTVYASATALVQQRARLPCDVTSSLHNDRVVLILWYRGSAGTPIYSFDARGSDTEKGKHWSDERLLERRAVFQLLPSSSWGVSKAPGSYLEIYPVQDRDEATYRCRVDYLLSPTKNTIINFTVVIPPNKPEIFDETGHLLTTESSVAPIIGPYNEGDPLLLICKVLGGRPPPKVEWLLGDEVKPSEVTHQSGGVIQVSTVVTHLKRSHLHAVLECRASNFEGAAPVASRVTLDMNFQPLNVSVTKNGKTLSADTVYELACKSWGARPPAYITWWKGGTQPMDDSVTMTTSDGNVTTSILKYRADMTDNGKYLTCRAENKHMEQSSKEDGVKLNILYKPVVTLQMGSTLDPGTIKEGDDVYFECHINANPDVYEVHWHHNGLPVQDMPTQRILIQNQTLVLQNINRDSAGLYTCRAENLEGRGESQPVNLNIMYKPYCKRQRKTIYGTALHEPASVTCEVEASPSEVRFRWTFNNTSEHLPIPSSAVTSKGLTSIASYAPKSHLDYGTLLCWAFNDVGKQSEPCAFTIIAAGPPDPPKNCTITNRTTNTIKVDCLAGFDGGLSQVFHMEIYDSDTGSLRRNLTSAEPQFLLTGLRPGIAFTMVTFSANAKGVSQSFTLETFTLKVAEKRTGPPTFFAVTPVMGVLIGVVLALVMSGLAMMVLMKIRRNPQGSQGDGHCQEVKRNLENQPLNVEVFGGQVKENLSSLEAPDESDPDIIPHKNDGVLYTDYDGLHQGPIKATSYDAAVTV